MKKAIVYFRVGNPDQLISERQREELHAKFGDTHEIVAEYRDDASGNLGVGDRPGLKKLLEDAAQRKFDVLLCTDLTRLARRLSPEVVTALRDAGVKVVTADGAEIGVPELVAQAIMNQSAKTESQCRSERIKRGKRASKTAGSGKRPTAKK